MLVYRKYDNAIVLNDAIELTETGCRGAAWHCNFITTSDYEIVEAQSPINFVPFAFVWNNGVEPNINYVPIQKDLTEIKAAKWEEIKAERDRRAQQGGYIVANKWFHSDQFSRTQQLGLVLAGANIPQGLQWKTMDGSFVPMTQSLANQVFAAAVSNDDAIFKKADQLRIEMEQDPETFNLSAAVWPPVFGE